MMNGYFDNKTAAAVLVVLALLGSALSGYATGWTTQPASPSQILAAGAYLLLSYAVAVAAGFLAKRCEIGARER
ncbi:hypothetical protein [Duganella vulcania]|uniref:Uncharacterized protein n=1 Tax=Duganella vulcania TaxID=2692166 RepID=A0A845GE30_9BURK|nr:hypothetical protein [Duganella vulcania]MYM92544.1 hypothetical protein [Duganella vulcania]